MRSKTACKIQRSRPGGTAPAAWSRRGLLPRSLQKSFQAMASRHAGRNAYRPDPEDPAEPTPPLTRKQSPRVRPAAATAFTSPRREDLPRHLPGRSPRQDCPTAKLHAAAHDINALLVLPAATARRRPIETSASDSRARIVGLAGDHLRRRLRSASAACRDGSPVRRARPGRRGRRGRRRR